MHELLKRTDRDILHDVARELEWDTRVRPTEIGIAVKNGVVTLSGNVDTWAELRVVEAAAHRVAGVLDVADDLVVKNEAVVERPGRGERSDTEIASAVRWALERDVAAPVSQIQSPVSQGTVVLEGVVAFWSQRADAESAVEHVPGVRRVVNRIAIEPARRHRPQTGPWSG